LCICYVKLPEDDVKIFEIFHNVSELYVNFYFGICIFIALNFKNGSHVVLIVQDYGEMQFSVYTCTNNIREM